MCRFKEATANTAKEYIEFQYIICVGSRGGKNGISNIQAVSIHHMCRFKNFLAIKSLANTKVSIHHMCRFKIGIFSSSYTIISFNTSYVSVQVKILARKTS